MVRFHALGTTQLVGADGREPRAILNRPKRLGLLAFLALARPRGFHRRDALAALFWPDLDDARARGALRQALHHLRLAFGADFILTRGDTEVALDGTRLWCDALDLERRADAGELCTALDLYRGPLLPAFHLSGCVEAERWLESERDWFARRASSVATALVRARDEAGDIAGAIEAARRAHELEPNDEAAARSLIALLARAGARGEALATYEAFARRLAEDMELEPSAETLALVQKIRAPVIPPVSPVESPSSSTVAGAGVTSSPHRTTSSRDDASRTRNEGASSPGTRPRPWLRAAVIAVLVFGAATYAEARRRNGTAADAARTTVAVLPFTVAGDRELAYLGEGLADLLSTHLDGAGELRAVDANVIIPHVEAAGAELDPVAGGRIAAHFDAGLYVLGGVIGAGGRIRARASLYDARGELLGTAHATVDDEQRLFELADDLARQLVALSPVQPRERLARSSAPTTGSFAALKAYLHAERLLRAGRYDSAVATYERAVAADSAFALAWYRMAVARHLDATPTGRADAHRRALVLADRLSPRDRMLVEAFDAFQRHQDREAERLYRELLSLHPDEVEAWVFLGEVIAYYGLRRGRSIADARHAIERALALDSVHVGALRQASWIAAMEERFDDVAAIADRMLALQADSYEGPAARMQLALARRDEDAERGAMAELRASESSYINRSQRWAHFSGNLEGRLRVARLLTEPSRPDRFRHLGHVVASRYLLDHGRWRDAFAELSPIERVTPDAFTWSWTRHHLRPFAPVAADSLERVAARIERWAPASIEHRIGRLYMLGVIAAKLRDSSGAARWASELEVRASDLARDSSLAREAALARDFAHGVRAWSAAESDRSAEALAHLERIRPEEWWRRGESGGLEMDAVQGWLRAEVLVRLGRDGEAMHYYAPLGFYWGDAGLLAPKHLRLGEIHERLGDRGRAMRHYRRFVTIWRDCDPELRPVVRDIEARIAKLERGG